MLGHIICTKFVAFFRRDLSFLFKIDFITDDIFFCLFINIFLNLINPSLHIIEGHPVSDIIHYDNPISPSIVTTCDRFEPILACRIPLNQNENTICSLIVSPLSCMYLIFYVSIMVRSQHRWYCSSYVRIFYHYTA